jgi:hypothetical protein
MMYRRGVLLLTLAGAPVIAVSVIGYQLYAARGQLGALFAGATTGMATAPRQEPRHIPASSRAATHGEAAMDRANARVPDRVLPLEEREIDVEWPEPNAPPFVDELADPRAATERLLADPDLDVRSEAAAVLDLLRAEDSAAAEPERAVGSTADEL